MTDKQAVQATTIRRTADPRPNCCDCGRFIGAGASMAMRYSGYPPTPDHEDFRCAPCVERLGPLTEENA